MGQIPSLRYLNTLLEFESQPRILESKILSVLYKDWIYFSEMFTQAFELSKKEDNISLDIKPVLISSNHPFLLRIEATSCWIS